jgi:hypothetical protein
LKHRGTEARRKTGERPEKKSRGEEGRGGKKEGVNKGIRWVPRD